MNKEKHDLAVVKVREYLAKGYDGWYWENMIQDIAPMLGVNIGERVLEATGHAARALRGAYKGMSVQDWETKAKAWSDVEVEHIIQLTKFEFEFTRDHRPAVDPSTIKLRGQKKAKKTKEGEVAPALPVPPAPPVMAGK